MTLGSEGRSWAEAADFTAVGLVAVGLVVALMALTCLREPAHELAFRWYELRGRPVGSHPWDVLEGILGCLLGTVVGLALIRYVRPLSRMVLWGERPILIEIAVTKKELLCVALSLLGLAAIARVVPAMASVGSKSLWAWPGMGWGIFAAASIAVHLLLGGFLFCAPGRTARLLDHFQKP